MECQFRPMIGGPYPSSVHPWINRMLEPLGSVICFVIGELHG